MEKSEEVLYLRFDEQFILKSSNPPRVQVLLEDQELSLDFLKKVYDQKQLEYLTLDKEQFLRESGTLFEDYSSGVAFDDIFVIYTVEHTSKLRLVNTTIDLESTLFDQISILSFIANKVDSSSVPKPRPIDQTSSCKSRRLWGITIRPENISLGLSSILNKPLRLLLVLDPVCVVEKVSTATIIKESSLSLMILFFANYIREIICSVLNNKDILDLVKYDSRFDKDCFSMFDSLLVDTTCVSTFLSYNEQKAFESNSKIKSRFIGDYDSKIRTLFYRNNFSLWFNEVKRQFEESLPSSIRAELHCRFKFAVTEYLSMILFVFYFLLKSITLAYVLVQSLKKKKIRFPKLVFWLSQSIKRILINSLLLVYYYNLVNFLILIRHSRSVFFGFTDFLILLVRALFLMFPMEEKYKTVSPLLVALYRDIFCKSAEDSTSGDSGIPLKAISTKAKKRVKFPNTLNVKYRSYNLSAAWKKKGRRLKIFMLVEKLFPKRSKKRLITNAKTGQFMTYEAELVEPNYSTKSFLSKGKLNVN